MSDFSPQLRSLKLGLDSKSLSVGNKIDKINESYLFILTVSTFFFNVQDLNFKYIILTSPIQILINFDKQLVDEGLIRVTTL